MYSNRQNELSNLQTYINNVDNEITLILQSLQWDRNTLISEKPTVTCAFNITHKLPPENKEKHEKQCWLKHQGYNTEDKMLPEPLDPNANTIVKLCCNDIKLIIESASKNNSNFKKGNGWNAPAPLTLERAQATYTVDERRAIYDAVVASAPTCHDLSDLALFDHNAVKSENKTKSRVEILAELRDMKRRRTKYRVAAKTKNYSDVLRDVIKTQMDLYTDVQIEGSCNSDANTNLELTRKDNNNHHRPIKRERSTTLEQNDNEGRNYKEHERKSYPHYRNDFRDTRSSSRNYKRQGSNSTECCENTDKRNVCYSHFDKEKRDRKEKDDHRKEITSKKYYDQGRDKHKERYDNKYRDNRQYDERHKDDHKSEGRFNNKYSRDYVERGRNREGRYANDKYNRDKQRPDNYNREDRTQKSKYDSYSREFRDDMRYWNYEARIKQEDEIHHDRYEHGQKRNESDDRNQKEVKIKEEDIDSYKY